MFRQAALTSSSEAECRAKLRPGYEWDQMNKILDELEVEDYLSKH